MHGAATTLHFAASTQVVAFLPSAKIVLPAAAVSHAAAKGQVVLFLQRAIVVLLAAAITHVAANLQVVYFLAKHGKWLGVAARLHVAAKVQVVRFLPRAMNHGIIAKHHIIQRIYKQININFNPVGIKLNPVVHFVLKGGK